MIAHDFNLNLFLYRLPDWAKQDVERATGLKIFDVNDIAPEDITIFWGNRITTDDVLEMPNLRWIHLGCSGYDKLDLDVIPKNIKISRTSESIALSVSSTAVAMMYMLSKRLDVYLKSPCPSRRDIEPYAGNIHDPSNVTTLIVGRGNVGNFIKSTLSINHMDMCGSGDLNNTPINMYQYIICCTSYRPGKNDNIFNKNIFKRMARNAYFINVGRGELVNEKDLLEAVKSGEIAGAALDVVKNEPIEMLDPLLSHRNIIITPHIAAYDGHYWIIERGTFIHNFRALDDLIIRMWDIVR